MSDCTSRECDRAGTRLVTALRECETALRECETALRELTEYRDHMFHMSELELCTHDVAGHLSKILNGFPPIDEVLKP